MLVLRKKEMVGMWREEVLGKKSDDAFIRCS